MGGGVSFRRRFVVNIRSKADGAVTIGDNVFFNNDCSINCMDRIVIGSDCVIGENVKFYDHNHVFSDSHELIRTQGFSTAPINVGPNCWIGSGVIVLAGVTIGAGCVIGANAVIAKDVPAGSVVVAHQDIRVKPR